MDPCDCTKELTIDYPGSTQTVAAYMKVLRKTENFNALKAIDILSKAPVRKNYSSVPGDRNPFMPNTHFILDQ